MSEMHRSNSWSRLLSMVIVASVVVGGGDQASGQQVAVATPAVPTFKDGQAQIVDAFKNAKEWIRHDLWVETSFDSDNNGTMDRVHVSVTRQKQTDTEGLKVPVVYYTSPYFAGVSAGGPDYMWDPGHELGAKPPVREHPPEIKHRSLRPSISRQGTRNWIPRGYAVVHSCSPGTGLSQGCPSCGGLNEALAPKAVIDWLCGRAKGFTTPDGNEEVTAFWSTGKVGMTGTSYNGTLPIAAATTGVDGLEAVIPISPNTSYYHYYRANGLVRHPGGYMGEDIDVLYDFIHSGDPEMRESCNKTIRDELMIKNQDRQTGDYNDFWDSRDYVKALENYKTPTLLGHGFNDWNVMPSHSIRLYQALKEKGVPVRAYFSQGNHGAGSPPLAHMNRWFTRYLHGVENGVEKDPRAWIVRENDSRRKPTPYDDYPNPAASPVELYLSGNGQQVGALSLTAMPEKQGRQTLIDDATISGSDLVQEPSNHRLLFATPVLKSPVHLSGTSTIKVKLASNKPAANVSVWMVSLPWTTAPGHKPNENIITRGWADPQNRKSLRKSEALVPGQFYELSFELEPDDQIIPAGQQIGLMIFSSDRDFTLWPEPGTELTIDVDATAITIPVVGGAGELKKAIQ